MKIKFSDMSSMIAEEVISLISPKIRKIVREEVNRGVKSIIQEQKKLEKLSLLSNAKENSKQDYDGYDAGWENNIHGLSESKEAIAKRAHDKARSILKKRFANNDDPFADLIMNAEDPQEEQKIEEQVRLSTPLKKVSEVGKNDNTSPDLMDFNEMVDRII